MIIAALEILGAAGGQVPGAMDHECSNCLHEKRYREDLAGAVQVGAADQVADIDDMEENPVSKDTPQAGFVY